MFLLVRVCNCEQKKKILKPLDFVYIGKGIKGNPSPKNMPQIPKLTNPILGSLAKYQQ